MVDSTEKTLTKLQQLLPPDPLLQEHFMHFCNMYEKELKRRDKIFKQTDRQQRQLAELNDKILQQKDELSKLHNYNLEQQHIAKEKLESIIVNDYDSTKCKVDIIYKPADVLSGDFYSLLHLKDGSLLVYLLDGQGHGFSSALTIFSVSSTIAGLVTAIENFDELIDKLFPKVKHFLGEIEQLSFLLLNISADYKEFSYTSGGLYPFLVKTEEEILRIKSNNLPFMNFSPTPKITTQAMNEWKSLILYTDGLVEEIGEELSEFNPVDILKSDRLFQRAYETLMQNSYEDDITVLKISKKG